MAQKIEDNISPINFVQGDLNKNRYDRFPFF